MAEAEDAFMNSGTILSLFSFDRLIRWLDSKGRGENISIGQNHYMKRYQSPESDGIELEYNWRMLKLVCHTGWPMGMTLMYRLYGCSTMGDSSHLTSG